MATLSGTKVSARIVHLRHHRWTRFDPPNILARLVASTFASAALLHPAPVNSAYYTKDYRQIDPIPNTLILGIPAVIPVSAAKAPFVQSDWPLPLRRPVKDLSWFQTPEVIPQVPDVAVAIRIPNQTDWPNPLRPWVRDLTWTQTPETILPVLDLQSTDRILRQSDWPNPLRPWIRDLTWTQTPEVIPQVPDVALAVRIQSRQETPNPVLRISQREWGWIWTPKPSEIPPVVLVPPGTPFTQLDWPNPQPRVDLGAPVMVHRVGAERVDPISAFGVPFAQTEFPNPVLRISPRQWGWVWTPNPGDIPFVPAPPVIVQPPFSQDNWPNPVLKKHFFKHPQSVRPEPEPEGSPGTPFAQSDFPNPVLRISPREWGFTWRANIGDYRVIGASSDKGFPQLNWPNPVLRTPFKESGWIHSPNIPDIPAAAEPPFVQPPFVQADWPNATLRIQFREPGWIWTPYPENIPQILLPVQPIPFAGVIPSGGWHPYLGFKRTWKKDIPDEVVEVIEELAREQLEDLIADQQTPPNLRSIQLKQALQARGLNYQKRYFEALKAERELLIHDEIARRLHDQQDEEDIVFLLMSLISQQ